MESEIVKWILTNVKDNPTLVLFVFSMLINVVLLKAVHMLFQTMQAQQTAMTAVLSEVKTALTTNNTLLQFLTSKRSR